jgi:hypothetical protein
MFQSTLTQYASSLNVVDILIRANTATDFADILCMARRRHTPFNSPITLGRRFPVQNWHFIHDRSPPARQNCFGHDGYALS